MSHRVRIQRSAENALEELEFLASEERKKLIFIDDSFTPNTERVSRFAEK